MISDRSGKIVIPCTNMDGCNGVAPGYPSEDELVVYQTAFMETPPALKLPLTLQGLQQMGDGLTQWNGAGRIDAAPGAYAVALWLGPKAPAADRSAILGALQAIKPRVSALCDRLGRAGTRATDEFHAVCHHRS